MALLFELMAGGVGLATGAGLSWKFLRARRRRRTQKEAGDAELVLTEARQQAEEILHEARLGASERALQERSQLESSLSAKRSEQEERESRLSQREALLATQLERIVSFEQDLKSKQEELSRQAEQSKSDRDRLAELIRHREDQLQALAGISREQAREEFPKVVEAASMSEASNLSRSIVEEARRTAEEKAKDIIGIAIQRYASGHTNEVTTTTIALEDGDLKGRIIGREGRNIRAFENTTGVTVLIDDTPNTVVLSSFDPVRREIAREVMTRLIQDGRIHPNRIEEVVTDVTQEMEETIVRIGEEAVARVGVSPPHPDLVNVLGRLHFRNSFSQNLLHHSTEVAHLMGLMAAEIGVDVRKAKKSGLLHDIGKALDHEVQGPHALVGADLVRRRGESETVANAVASHHNDVPPKGVLGILVNAADAISASRPGARSESMATYLKRVEDLERIGTAEVGVDKCYAVQAGRELRVFVQPGDVNDDAAFALARRIAQRVEWELHYPGQIRVTVIRETRCVEVAR